MHLRRIVADNLRGHRIKCGLTQEALAGKVGMGANHLARIERSEEGLSLERWEKLAKALKIAPHLLLVPESYKRE